MPKNTASKNVSENETFFVCFIEGFRPSWGNYYPPPPFEGFYTTRARGAIRAVS